tara:strand:+ start:8260 stop:8559 length:300 start_codon:yes stop_codon:yes gene_type:complete
LSCWFAVKGNGNILNIMYHSGGFGNNDDFFDRPMKKKKSKLAVPILCMVAGLSLWGILFYLGLSMGFGWFAWPLGSVFFILAFLLFGVISVVKQKTGKK